MLAYPEIFLAGMIAGIIISVFVFVTVKHFFHKDKTMNVEAFINGQMITDIEEEVSKETKDKKFIVEGSRFLIFDNKKEKMVPFSGEHVKRFVKWITEKQKEKKEDG